MYCLFIPSIPKDKPLKITGQYARYILNVIRQKKGDSLIVFDSDGNRYKVEILKTGIKEVYAEIKESLPSITESRLRLSLVQGILKGQKMDLVIQKATELGVKEIIPLITQRTEVRETKKLLRWQKIALEAGRQSGRNLLPSIMPPIKLSDFLLRASSLKGFIFWEGGGIGLKEAVIKLTRTFSMENDSIFMVVGPEGGFEEKEVEEAEAKGLCRVSLGNRILRAETSAIAVAAVIQTLMGDMGGN